MRDSSRSDDLPAEVAARLDELLARWGAARRLSSAQAAAVRETVLASADEFGYEWWQAVLGQFHGIAVTLQAHSLEATAGLAALAHGHWAPTAEWPYSTERPAGYVPYLRLT